MDANTDKATATSTNDFSAEVLIRFYSDMLRIRRFEETAIYHSSIGELHGALHVCIGQEAVPVGMDRKRASCVRRASLRRSCLILLKTCSIGFRSGL